MQYDEDSDGKISRAEYCLDPFMDLNAGIWKLNKYVTLVCHPETYIYHICKEQDRLKIRM
jgi:hypothetical protein